MNLNQDVQVRAIDVIRSNVGSGRTTAPAAADGGLHPTKSNLPPKRESQLRKRPGQYDDSYKAYGVPGIHVSLEGNLRRKGRFVDGRSNP